MFKIIVIRDVDYVIVAQSHQGLQIQIFTETEDHLLILHCMEDMELHEHRMLSMKFKPKLFGDLVGQDVVVRSLLGAISSGRKENIILSFPWSA